MSNTSWWYDQPWHVLRDGKYEMIVQLQFGHCFTTYTNKVCFFPFLHNGTKIKVFFK
jgi:hypothetical protein